MTEQRLPTATRSAGGVSPYCNMMVFDPGEWVETEGGTIKAARLRPGDRIGAPEGDGVTSVLWVAVHRGKGPRCAARVRVMLDATTDAKKRSVRDGPVIGQVSSDTGRLMIDPVQPPERMPRTWVH